MPAKAGEATASPPPYPDQVLLPCFPTLRRQPTGEVNLLPYRCPYAVLSYRTAIPPPFCTTPTRRADFSTSTLFPTNRLSTAAFDEHRLTTTGSTNVHLIVSTCFAHFGDHCYSPLAINVRFIVSNIHSTYRLHIDHHPGKMKALPTHFGNHSSPARNTVHPTVCNIHSTYRLHIDPHPEKLQSLSHSLRRSMST